MNEQVARVGMELFDVYHSFSMIDVNKKKICMLTFEEDVGKRIVNFHHHGETTDINEQTISVVFIIPIGHQRKPCKH
jgi:hypothetical protein